MTKNCTRCRQSKALDLFYRDVSKPDGHGACCKDCKKTKLLALPDRKKKERKAYQAMWDRAHPDYQRQWRKLNQTKRLAHRLSVYGITHERYLAMRLEQGDKCLICRTPFGTPHVDHDHKTGKVRGLLCKGCNVGLGFFRDNSSFLREAASYLDSSR